MITAPSPADRRDALRYTETLCGSDDAVCTWQIFDDTGKDWRKARHWSAPLRKVGKRLIAANLDGCGVFCTVAETDGQGRRARNIRRIRALFVDFDGVTPKSAHLRPSMIIQSAAGQHWYWVTTDCRLDDFAGAQKRLAAYYGSDPVVHDLPRVMRVPGFWHCKRAPVMVRLVDAPGHRYTAAQVLDGLPPLPEPARPPQRPFAPLPGQRLAGWRNIDAVQAFADAGYYGRPMGDGKHAVLCPWVSEHTRPDVTGLAADTVLWETGTQGRAVFRCSHAHCQGRYLVHALAAIGWRA